MLSHAVAGAESDSLVFGPAIAITSVNYHTLIDFPSPTSALILGWVTSANSTTTYLVLGYAAAPSYMFILPLVHLIPMNTSPYLSSPGLTVYSFSTILLSIYLARHEQMEQRLSFQGQVC